MLHLKILNYYQYISKLFPQNCRYYPSCSEYAKQQFIFNRLDKALILSILRILKCNQLFKGGINYPIVLINKILNRELLKKYLSNKNIKYWIIHKNKNKYYILKNISNYK